MPVGMVDVGVRQLGFARLARPFYAGSPPLLVVPLRHVGQPPSNKVADVKVVYGYLPATASVCLTPYLAAK